MVSGGLDRVMQSAGDAYRLDGQRLKAAIHRNGGMPVLLWRYTQTLIAQMAEIAVCNRHHTVAQQVCLWLLLCLDRLFSNAWVMTQKLIASMLGARREGVTDIARKLQKKTQRDAVARGQSTVLDRAKRDCPAFECYAMVMEETDRLLDAPITRI